MYNHNLQTLQTQARDRRCLFATIRYNDDPSFHLFRYDATFVFRSSEYNHFKITSLCSVRYEFQQPREVSGMP